MSINQWANVTLDTSAITDRASLHNTVAAGTAAANHLSVSWDNAVITTMTKWDAAVAAARQIAAGSLTP